MNENNLLKAFEKLGVWESGDQRAPHKPLTLLYALSQLQHGNDRFKYAEAYLKIEKLLKIYLVNTKTLHKLLLIL